MKKIMVMAVSSGAGKSTFARELGEILQIKVHHLDALYWEPGWVEIPIEAFVEAQKKIIHHDSKWIIEGNYTSTYDVRAESADTIIYLELPLYVCLYRVIKRWLTYRGKTRPDMGKNCPEKLDWEFIWYIISTYYPRKRKMMKRLDEFQAKDSGKKVYKLKGNKQINSFLEHVKLKT